MPQRVSTFQPHQLVMTHLSDPRHDGRSVPVSGVVVRSSREIADIRVRNLDGQIAVVRVLVGDLTAR